MEKGHNPLTKTLKLKKTALTSTFPDGKKKEDEEVSDAKDSDEDENEEMSQQNDENENVDVWKWKSSELQRLGCQSQDSV